MDAHAAAAKPIRGSDTKAPPTSAEVLANASAKDWKSLDPANTLYLQLKAGRVVIELAPQFAPHHVANIKALAREHYYDGLAIVRAQDNYVVQMNDPLYEDVAKRRPIKTGHRTLAPEFTAASKAVPPFVKLPDPDTYAPQTGFSGGFAAARNPKTGRTWLTHCYGTVGAGRLNSPNSGSGAELYVVIGTSPRQLDRNATVVGRVVQGMELLSTLPRGPAPMGMYKNAEDRTPIVSMRVAADLPVDQRTELQVLRTDTDTFHAWIESRRNRHEAWFVDPGGHIDVCNVPIPVRDTPKPHPSDTDGD